MVATQSQQGSSANAKSYELTQQARDAKSAAVCLKTNQAGKIINLEEWRRGLDVMFGLMNASHYTDENSNLYIQDPTQIMLAKAEVQMNNIYTQTNIIKTKQDEVVEEKHANKGDDDKNVMIMNAKEMHVLMNKKTAIKQEVEEELEKLEKEAESESKKPYEENDDQTTRDFVNGLIAMNMMNTQKTTENEDMVFFVNSLLCIHHNKMNERVLTHMNTLGYSRLYVVERKMLDGTFELHHAPLEDYFGKRKRTIVYNLILETIKEIKSYLYHHIKFGDVASLISWVTETYGVDRRADRIRSHFKKFKTLSNDQEIKNFDNWYAKAIGYLANDTSLGLGTPAIFVKLQLQEGIDLGGSEELKQAWHEAENDLIRANKKAGKNNKKFSFTDLEAFLGEIKTRFHTYQNQGPSPRRTRRVNRTERSTSNNRNTNFSGTNGNGNNNRQNQNHNQRNGNTNASNVSDRPKICAFHNMIYGCNKTECKFDHVVLMDDEKRAKLIEIASKGSRCTVCGISGHEKKECKKKEDMKKIITERNGGKRNVRRSNAKNRDDQQQEGVQGEEDDE